MKNLGKWFALYNTLRLADENGEPTEACMRLAKTKPFFVCSQYKLGGRRNLTSQVIDLFHSYNVKVFAHIWGHERADPNIPHKTLDETLAMIDEALTVEGIDGLWFGEVYHFMRQPQIDPTGERKQYFIDCYNHVKNINQDLTVVFNTGTNFTSEEIMNYCDILSVETRWASFAVESKWWKNYAADRFVGVTKELNWKGEMKMVYRVSLARAVYDTKEAWNLGFGFHSSSVRADALSVWLEDYARLIYEDGEVPQSISFLWLLFLLFAVFGIVLMSGLPNLERK